MRGDRHLPAGLLPKTQSVGTDCRGHRRTRHGGESCGATASLTTSPDDPLFLDLPLRMPRVASRAALPKKGRARGEKHSFATLEASVLGPSVTGVVRAHAFQIEASVPADSSQNHPLKSTKTLHLIIPIPKILRAIVIVARLGEKKRWHGRTPTSSVPTLLNFTHPAAKFQRGLHTPIHEDL